MWPPTLSFTGNAPDPNCKALIYKTLPAHLQRAQRQQRTTNLDDCCETLKTKNDTILPNNDCIPYPAGRPHTRVQTCRSISPMYVFMIIFTFASVTGKSSSGDSIAALAASEALHKGKKNTEWPTRQGGGKTLHENKHKKTAKQDDSVPAEVSSKASNSASLSCSCNRLRTSLPTAVAA